ncbi:MAG: hypothetical protein COV72_07025 [Candidatus Omnitrophica bacterium CG11_big_fil_rev_8_21_14_0_20_42_13]|uniref:Uncharacterized protein n=1 Tax=Candidatus Ghiorseimicrobium undicola TaxID=1974746 RepID=A0A2H0LW72_9BACT|nr:MAG: hypothetical protein COV72_07025 [Candidatus Omnitrophica bacterium CG11_big_fil_rev_8_21_14_0_20_42_13]
MIRKNAKLLFIIFFSLICHLCFFIPSEINFASSNHNFNYPGIHFLGGIIDSSDFSDMGNPVSSFSAGYKEKPPLILSGQNLEDNILYKLSKLNLLTQDRLYMAGAGKKNAPYSKLFFLNIKKPQFSYAANVDRAINFSGFEITDSKKYGYGLTAPEYKLKNPFFYKELFLSAIEAEFLILPQSRIAVVRKIVSSGDFEADIFAIKSMRRKLYLRGGMRDSSFEKALITFSDD